MQTTLDIAASSSARNSLPLSQTLEKNSAKVLHSSMAYSKSSLVALMAILFAVLSTMVAAEVAEAPAPSPVSPAVLISPSFGSACAAAVLAVVFGSAIRV